jgi:hypothetical protein
MRAVQKVDVFPATGEFHRTQLERATVLRLGEDKVPCAVTTAEDILLAKLRRYADGGEVPDRQWNDIVGLLATNEDLDNSYLESCGTPGRERAARTRSLRRRQRIIAATRSSS